MEKNIPSRPDSFREACSSAYLWSPRSFRWRVLFRSLHPHGIPIFLMLFPFKTKTVRKAISLVDEAGDARSSRELDSIIAYHLPETKMYGGVFARYLRVRVSGTRLARVFKKAKRRASNRS
jgi:hypothetical protein